MNNWKPLPAPANGATLEYYVPGSQCLPIGKDAPPNATHWRKHAPPVDRREHGALYLYGGKLLSVIDIAKAEGMTRTNLYLAINQAGGRDLADVLKERRARRKVKKSC
jgi:hypothetical protein